MSIPPRFSALRRPLRALLPRAGAGLLALGLIPCLSGCDIVGVLAGAVTQPTIQARYKELKGQSVAVMVWADRGTSVDYSRLSIDIASMVQRRLNSKEVLAMDTMKGATFPLSPETVYRYQVNHPEIEAEPIEEVATRLGVSRLIYIEVDGFTTRTEQSLSLFRGDLSATLKVVEVHDGKAKVTYEENNVHAIYPPDSTADGMPDLGDATVYRGTLDQFATTVMNRFVAHPDPDPADRAQHP